MSFDDCFAQLDDTDRDELIREEKWKRRMQRHRTQHWHPSDPEYLPPETDDDEDLD